MNAQQNGLAIWRERASLLLLVARESFRSFSSNNNLQTAATLAYYGFFSLIPLLLLVVILLSHLTLSSDTVMNAVENLTAQILPQSNKVILQEIYTLAGQKVWGWLSVIVLIWAITPFATAIRIAFTQIFKAERKLVFWKTKLLNVAAVVALLALFISLVLGKIISSSLVGAHLAGQAGSLAALLQLAVAMVVSVVFVSFFFLVFCPVRLRLSELLTGALVTTFLLFIIRPVFALVLQFNPNYGYAFGSLKAIFIVTVWVYYSFLVILFGTEVMANTRRKEALLLRGLFLPAKKSARPSPLLQRFIRTYEADTVLFQEGDPGGEMFYVLSGEVSVTKGEKVIKQFKPGDYFGEMAMLLDEPRTATAVVSAHGTQLVPISPKNMDTLLRENPRIVQSLLKEMAQRLKTTTTRL